MKTSTTARPRASRRPAAKLANVDGADWRTDPLACAGHTDVRLD